MSLWTERRSPFAAAYFFARRSGFLNNLLGQRLFKSAYFVYKRYIEDNLQKLVEAVPGLVGEGNILDIGANIGYTASVLARAAKPGCQVLAFEPEPFNFGILQQTASQPEFADKIIPLQLAVGAEDGVIDLWINERHHADHRIAAGQFRSAHHDSKPVSVPLVKIDSFLARRPGAVSFVKIDVQGYELAVCQGMRNTLEQNPGISVVLEYMPSAMRELGFDASHLIDFFVERDFKIYQVHPKGNLSPGVPPVLKDADYFDLLFTRRSIGSSRKGREA
jgi:FkbM family methyltransferase